ncbi:unnamed protein product [Aphanomyces euteiches]
MRRFVLLADPAPILIIEDDAIRNDEKAMPQKPIAYAADYVHAEENYISMRQRQLMDVAHRHHLEHIEAPIKKDIVLNYTKTNSPNKKKQQQVQEAEASHRLSQQISKTTKRAKTRKHQRKHQQGLLDKQATADDFEFLVLDDQQSQLHLALKTVKSVKEHVQSKLPLIHNKANAYLAQHKLDPFEVPRRPFE